MSVSLAFLGGKPCCNKKAGKNTVTCKFNQATIEKNDNLDGKLIGKTLDEDQKSFICNASNGNQCAKSCTNKPWWKFWAMKSAENCRCKQANASEYILAE